MTLAIDASPDHVSPYPPFGAPCCGRPVTDREPVPPGWMLLDGQMDGLSLTITTEAHAMSPALRGASAPALRGTRRPWGPSPRAGLSCGCGYGPRCGCGYGLRGLDDFSTDLIATVNAEARAWLASSGLTVSLPPAPSDVIVAVWRLAETERDLEMLRQKLRRMRASGIMRPEDLTAYNNAAETYYAAAKAVYTPVINMIRTASPMAAAAIPPISRPLGLDAPDRPLPWVPSEGELSRIRAGDLTGGSASFRDAIDYVRSRVARGTGTRGLGEVVTAGITIGTLVLIVIGLLAIAVVAVAIAVPAYALVQVLAAWVAARAAGDVAARRKDLYDACVARGESGAACAAEAERLAPMPQVPPGPGISVGLGVGGLVIGAAAVGAAWYFLGTAGGRARTREALSYTPAYGPKKPRKRGRTLRW